MVNSIFQCTAHQVWSLLHKVAIFKRNMERQTLWGQRGHACSCPTGAAPHAPAHKRRRTREEKKRVPADNVSIFLNASNHAINILCNVRACYYLR